MAAGKGKADRVPTRRTVLERRRVVFIPDDVDPDEMTLASLGLSKSEAKSSIGEAWVEVGDFDGTSKTNAIEAYAGRPDDPDAKLGVWKAPPSRGWRGVVEHRPPAQQRLDRRVIADA